MEDDEEIFPTLFLGYLHCLWLFAKILGYEIIFVRQEAAHVHNKHFLQPCFCDGTSWLWAGNDHDPHSRCTNSSEWVLYSNVTTITAVKLNATQEPFCHMSPQLSAIIRAILPQFGLENEASEKSSLWGN